MLTYFSARSANDSFFATLLEHRFIKQEHVWKAAGKAGAWEGSPLAVVKRTVPKGARRAAVLYRNVARALSLPGRVGPHCPGQPVLWLPPLLGFHKAQ